MIETLRSLARAAGYTDLPLRAPRRPLSAREAAALAYEGARSDRRQGGWYAPSTSGNSELGPAIGKLRDNAEDLARNNAFGSKSVRRWCRRVVGYGIVPQADTGNATVNAIIDGWWKRWVTQCSSDQRMNFYAEQRRIVRTAFVRGECLIRLWDRFEEDGVPAHFQIQVMEPDQLDKNKTQATNSGYIIHGVQFDLLGRIVGYWLFPAHPGDPSTSFVTLQSKFISADAIIHHVPLERPGDVRGASRFASIIAKLRDLDEYSDAEIVRKKIEACLAMFVGQPNGDGPEGATLGAITDADGKKIESFEPGMIAYGAAGQQPEFFSPTTGGDYSEHKRTELREITAGMDQPYVVIGNDLSDVNYSSFRGGAIDERDSWDEYRWLWLVPQVLDRIWAKFIDKLFTMGEIPEPNYGVKWNPPAFDLLDRLAEAEADALELLIGKKTWPQLVGEQGNDPEKQIAEIEAWKARLEAAGVRFSTSGNGGQQNAQPNRAAAAPAAGR